MPGRRGSGHTRRYPRTARLNEVLREILAEALETRLDEDGRLELVTITGVVCDPDLRHATVYFSGRTAGAEEALNDQRVRLQGEIGRQTRLKRTPQLSFVADPGVTTGWRIEEVLKGLSTRDDSSKLGGDDDAGD
ncbi:MAG: ribosome-binding factor A [Actinomycetota bacterium]|nr:ribosome-binding factor A [Actinomycetota bacterium]